MNRKSFLKGTGLAGLGLILPKVNSSAKTSSKKVLINDCTLIPSEDAGPFPLDLNENPDFLKQDIREDREGVPMNLKIRIVGENNCEPMPNVRVNIWHCDKEGLYSGYDIVGGPFNNPGQEGLTYLRGYQFTDANGEVEFTTIFPGWYSGRVCHIHFQVFVSTSYSVISQLTWEKDDINEVYNEFPDIYTNGEDPTSHDSDLIFQDGHEFQLATLTPNSDIGGYDAFFEATVQGEGTVSIGYIEQQTAKIFELGQNMPNPFYNQTTIPVSVLQKSDIKLELWDLNGKKVATVFEQPNAIGDFSIEVNLNELGLPNGNYIYQFEAINSNGTFRLPKLMTLQK